jgi:glycine cleavage system H lipoate-binding protein
LDDTGVITAVEPVVADEEMAADEEFVSAEDFKAFMLKFQSDIDAKLVEANKTIKMQAEKIKQMEAFQTSKFNYQAKEVKSEGGSYKDLLNKKK